jgi:hypothetical protein
VIEIEGETTSTGSPFAMLFCWQRQSTCCNSHGTELLRTKREQTKGGTKGFREERENNREREGRAAGQRVSSLSVAPLLAAAMAGTACGSILPTNED